MLTQYADFSVRWNHRPSILPARAVVNGEQSLLVLAGAGSGKTSVLVARAGWLLTTGEAVADQILLLAFGRKAAQEMDERIQARLHTRISRRARSTPSLYTSFNRAAKSSCCQQTGK